MATPSSHRTRVDRRDTARRLLQRDLEQLTPEERVVVERFISGGRVSRNVRRELHESRTLGERVADRVAEVGGSWTFILCFGVVLVVWMVVNTFLLARAFDPYPYILLNLVLSCLAAVQAPIIMMSQNRQAAKDRLTASVDYEINLRAELEIMRLHDKLDQMRFHELREKVDDLCERLDRRR